MKKLLLITVMLLGSITYAQCNPEIQDGCDVFEPETTEFDFNIDNCSIDFNTVKTELNDIVTLFFTELYDYNYYYGFAEHVAANPNTYPFAWVDSSTYNVTIETFPFTYGAAADVSTSQNGDITNITININEDKYYELSNDEYLGYVLDGNGNQVTDNYGNTVKDVRALAYLKKRMLIFHELGHAVLGLDHPCNTEKDIMNTSQCPRANGSQYNLSFPDDFPVENITTWDNAVNRMFQGTQGGQVFFPVSSSTTSSSSSSAAATYPSQETAAAQAPREYYEGETELEYYGDTDLTNDQLQNRIDAIDNLSTEDFVTVKYSWETLNQVYFIQITDHTYIPIESEIAAVANLTTLTYSEFKDLVQWTIDWRNYFLSEIADNN